jgi:hypothetical protein
VGPADAWQREQDRVCPGVELKYSGLASAVRVAGPSDSRAANPTNNRQTPTPGNLLSFTVIFISSTSSFVLPFSVSLTRYHRSLGPVSCASGLRLSVQELCQNERLESLIE